MQNISEYPKLELVELVQWYVDRYPRYRVKLTELLERAKEEDFSSFDGNSISCEDYYEQEVDLILDPPDPDDKSGSDWVEFI